MYDAFLHHYHNTGALITKDLCPLFSRLRLYRTELAAELKNENGIRHLPLETRMKILSHYVTRLAADQLCR